MSEFMEITVNGEMMTFPTGTTIAGIVSTVLGAKPEQSFGVAAALASRVVPRSAWTTTPVVSGSAVELVTATQGG